MPEYAGICLNEQHSEYAWGPKYAKVLNVAGFSMCERYTASWRCQFMPWHSSEYISGSKYSKGKFWDPVTKSSRTRF